MYTRKTVIICFFTMILLGNCCVSPLKSGDKTNAEKNQDQNQIARWFFDAARTDDQLSFCSLISEYPGQGLFFLQDNEKRISLSLRMINCVFLDSISKEHHAIAEQILACDVSCNKLCWSSRTRELFCNALISLFGKRDDLVLRFVKKDYLRLRLERYVYPVIEAIAKKEQLNEDIFNILVTLLVDKDIQKNIIEWEWTPCLDEVITFLEKILNQKAQNVKFAEDLLITICRHKRLCEKAFRSAARKKCFSVMRYMRSYVGREQKKIFTFLQNLEEAFLNRDYKTIFKLFYCQSNHAYCSNFIIRSVIRFLVNVYCDFSNYGEHAPSIINVFLYNEVRDFFVKMRSLNEALVNRFKALGPEDSSSFWSYLFHSVDISTVLAQREAYLNFESMENASEERESNSVEQEAVSVNQDDAPTEKRYECTGFEEDLLSAGIEPPNYEEYKASEYYKRIHGEEVIEVHDIMSAVSFKDIHRVRRALAQPGDSFCVHAFLRAIQQHSYDIACEFLRHKWFPRVLDRGALVHVLYFFEQTFLLRDKPNLLSQIFDECLKKEIWISIGTHHIVEKIIAKMCKFSRLSKRMERYARHYKFNRVAHFLMKFKKEQNILERFFNVRK